jgi:general secretion pathway protein D
VGEELVVLPLKYATASDISKVLSQLFVKTAAAKGRRVESLKIIPYERINSLIVFASKNNIDKVRELIARVDTEAPKGTGKIQVYYLQHASAEELVKVLTSLPESSGNAKDPKAIASAPPISKDLRIMADVETNSLIVVGPREEYLVLEEVIQKLDIPRRMVYIEALIMEVKVTKQFEVGVQWGGGGLLEDGTGKVYTGFSGSAAGYSDLQGENNITSDTYSLGAGFTLGVLKQGIQIGNMFFPNLSAVMKAYKDDSDVEIIATPQILTTDNKEAEIKVGENVPFITSRNVSAGQQDYTNYEYKDVATSLKILPQINQSDLVRLEIDVEVIKLKTATDTPTTLKRTANTTVVLHNEETVVIGGIIGQDTSSGEYKVPLLGDIPLLGWLFKTQSENTDKTNLFIFITPRIVENPAEIASIYYQKRDVMDYVKSGTSAIPDLTFKEGASKSHAVALTDIGFTNLQKNKLNRARMYFIKALEINPQYVPALLNLGALAEKQGNTDEAVKIYRQILALQPEAVDDEEENIEAERRLENAKDIAEKSLERISIEKSQSTPPDKKAPDKNIDFTEEEIIL